MRNKLSKKDIQKVKSVNTKIRILDCNPRRNWAWGTGFVGRDVQEVSSDQKVSMLHCNLGQNWVWGTELIKRDVAKVKSGQQNYASRTASRAKLGMVNRPSDIRSKKYASWMAIQGGAGYAEKDLVEKASKK